MDAHITAVGQAAAQTGGLTNNLLTTAHHSTGKGWGSGDGHTVGHPSEKLRMTIIPKEDEKAKAVILAAQKHLNGIATLLGENDPAVMTANSQLGLVKKTDGAGMNLLDFGVMMTQIMHAPNQAVARAHSGTKEGGHAPHLRAPKAGAPETEQETPETAQSGGEASQSQPAAPVAQGAPAPPAPAQPAAPAPVQG